MIMFKGLSEKHEGILLNQTIGWLSCLKKHVHVTLMMAACVKQMGSYAGSLEYGSFYW
ncbi:hypothetical protein Hdeb2414_s0005g00163171 [Helianthus debilis subsp. tardiflorus]